MIPEVGAELFSSMGEGSSVSMAWGGLSVLPTSWMVYVKGACTVSYFAPDTVFVPGSSKVAVGLFSLCIFWVQNLLQLLMVTVIFSPIQFPCILLLEERCVQVQAL